ncbi:endonuclease/exonuclease/phosphatase family protein [Streptomyces cinnabarinus]|uniref:Endonuclease/exonuclease/phosphatase family protein n=1 Tax=Streptomyces cinnabarinus TaxID=67287 RepID=A0ABY7KFD1_9ACTN|nr:endonuclease/exonuclease/phosphatase family protein [Streptomyces cinnabarinus]WAZ22375.1 endonuclease/exonuclease/phosphatase family protein [Streptomyces cinnabarinus]
MTEGRVAVRVMTWNLWWRFGPWRERQKAILSVLRDLRPDLVGLQEVWSADGENLAEWLAGELGLHWTWAPSPAPERWRRRIADPTVDIGNAVLSRWPVEEREVLRLPVPPDLDDGRLALYARTGPVSFITAHLTSAPDTSAVRAEQAAALAEFARRDGTVIVTGDFNAEPDSEELSLFRRDFRDAWTTADPATPSTTWDWDPALPYRLGGRRQPARIDYVHLGGQGSVRAVSRAGDHPVDGVWPSDHAAVVAELTVTDPT